MVGPIEIEVQSVKVIYKSCKYYKSKGMSHIILTDKLIKGIKSLLVIQPRSFETYCISKPGDISAREYRTSIG